MLGFLVLVLVFIWIKQDKEIESLEKQLKEKDEIIKGLGYED